MDSFGAYLKAHRESKGIRLEEIASITKIHLHSLELLEGNKWEQLPPEPFIRGFIIAYAKYVGLSGAEVIEKYREATGIKAEATAAAEVPPPPVAGPSGTPGEIITKVRLPSAPKLITAASLIAVVGIGALLINVGRESDRSSIAENGQPTPTTIAMTKESPAGSDTDTAVAAAPTTEDDRKVAEAAKTTLAAAAPAAAVSAPAPAAAPVAGAPAHQVVVEGKERTWIKVVIDDAPPTEFFLPEGKSATYQAAAKIKVVLGNATGAKVTHNGKEVEGKQFMGTIRSYKFPDNAHFPQDVPSKRTPTTGSAVSETASE